MSKQSRRIVALAALAALVALAGASAAALELDRIPAAVPPDDTARGGGYHLAAVAAPGQTYTLTSIDARAAPDKSQGGGYRLVSFAPEGVLTNVCVHLPIVLRQW